MLVMDSRRYLLLVNGHFDELLLLSSITGPKFMVPMGPTSDWHFEIQPSRLLQRHIHHFDFGHYLLCAP